MYVRRNSSLWVFLVVGALFASFRVSGADVFVRYYDGDVKKIIKKVANGESALEDALDGKFKDSMIRGPNGEVNVKNYLKDFRQDLKHLSERFSEKYSASTEVKDVLVRASTMNGYFHAHPELKGANSWDEFAARLQVLASAYSVSFPMAQDAVVRRVGDKELLDTITAAAKLPGSVDDAMQKVKKTSPTLTSASATGSKELDNLAAALKALKSRVSSKDPATAEARQVIAVGDRIGALLRDASAPESVTTPWQNLDAYLGRIAQAFGVSRASAPAS